MRELGFVDMVVLDLKRGPSLGYRSDNASLPALLYKIAGFLLGWKGLIMFSRRSFLGGMAGLLGVIWGEKPTSLPQTKYQSAKEWAESLAPEVPSWCNIVRWSFSSSPVLDEKCNTKHEERVHIVWAGVTPSNLPLDEWDRLRTEMLKPRRSGVKTTQGDAARLMPTVCNVVKYRTITTVEWRAVISKV